LRKSGIASFKSAKKRNKKLLKFKIYGKI
jgi:hypothetical protein